MWDSYCHSQLHVVDIQALIVVQRQQFAHLTNCNTHIYDVDIHVFLFAFAGPDSKVK